MKIVHFKPTPSLSGIGLAIALILSSAAPIVASNAVQVAFDNNRRDEYPRGRVGGGTY